MWKQGVGRHVAQTKWSTTWYAVSRDRVARREKWKSFNNGSTAARSRLLLSTRRRLVIVSIVYVSSRVSTL